MWLYSHSSIMIGRETKWLGGKIRLGTPRRSSWISMIGIIIGFECIADSDILNKIKHKNNTTKFIYSSNFCFCFSGRFWYLSRTFFRLFPFSLSEIFWYFFACFFWESFFGSLFLIIFICDYLYIEKNYEKYFYMLYKLCKLYEYFMNDLKSLKML